MVPAEAGIPASADKMSWVALLDGYIRVSQVKGRKGDRFISPAVQREQIEAWTSSHGAVLGEVFEELNESGGRADRPLLNAAIERIERGESDGLVVAKLDRFGRSLIDGLRALARIEAAGGTFVSVQDGIDISTPTGRLVSRILFAVGEWELERVRTNWDSARSRAVQRGVYICRRAPIGYSKGEDGRLRIDPVTAPIVREVFERRLRGQSQATIADFLNDSALRPEGGGVFHPPAVHTIISNCAYRGEARSGSHRNPQAHEPIVDPATWQAAQGAQRAPRRWVQALLVGRIRCAACGRGMSAVRPAGIRSRHNVYRCYGQKYGCPAPAHISTEELDPLVEEHLLRVATRWRPRSAAELAVVGCEEAIEEAERSLCAYRDNPRLLRTLGADSFEEGVAVRRRTVEKRLLGLAQARRALTRPRIAVADLERRWGEMSWEGRREVAAELVDCVLVSRGPESAPERVWLFGRGRGPLAGDSPALEVPVSTRGATRLRPLKPWPQPKLAKVLTAFLSGRPSWPTYLEFADAGQSRLHAQAMACGGPYYWAAKAGVEVPSRMVRWNEARIRGALKPFIGKRTDWPEFAEFEAAGMVVVHRAVRQNGGIDHWAEQLGMARPTKRKTWSKERIEPELITFLAGRETLPTMEEFRDGGCGRLYSAMRGHGGLAYWANRVGVGLAAGPLDRRSSRVRRAASHPGGRRFEST